MPAVRCAVSLAHRDFYFTTKQQLLSDARSKKFLETARVTVHSHPHNSSAAAAAAAPPQPLSYWYGTSLATVREVAATDKLCVMSLDVQGAEVGVGQRLRIHSSAVSLRTQAAAHKLN